MDIFFKKRCSEKLLKIHKKMPLSEFHFHQFVSCSSINLLKNNSKLRYRCFRVNNAKYFIAVFLHNTYEQLLLNLAFFLVFFGCHSVFGNYIWKMQKPKSFMFLMLGFCDGLRHLNFSDHFFPFFFFFLFFSIFRAS